MVTLVGTVGDYPPTNETEWLAFATLLFQVLRMVLGVPTETPTTTVGRRCRAFSSVAIAVNLGALVFLGLHIPTGLHDLIGAILPFFHAEGEYF